MTKIIFLGTNGWYDTDTGNTICILIDSPLFTIILDAGNGIAKLDRYADFNKPAYLFLSHFHLDHIAGPVSYTHLRAHETVLDLVCRLLLEKKKTTIPP